MYSSRLPLFLFSNTPPPPSSLALLFCRSPNDRIKAQVTEEWWSDRWKERLKRKEEKEIKGQFTPEILRRDKWCEWIVASHLMELRRIRCVKSQLCEIAVVWNHKVFRTLVLHGFCDVLSLSQTRHNGRETENYLLTQSEEQQCLYSISQKAYANRVTKTT